MNKTRLLLLSGMHGDEYEVISCVRWYIEQHRDKLPDFLYIPAVSPSAVSAHTRLNTYGHDVNRSFFTPSPDKEIKACIKILSKYSFQLSLDFHEDTDKTNEFYMYDTGKFTPKQLSLYRRLIKDIGLNLFNGVDDPSDKTLDIHIRHGYVSTPIDLQQIDSGFSSGYFIRHHISKRHLTLEIPGKLDILKKRELVAALFSFFLPFVS